MWDLIIAILLVMALAGIPFLVLIQSVKKEVNVAPRVPMFFCEKHGTFPAKYAIKISVPEEGKPDLSIDMCPFCYDEKMVAAEEVFKSGRSLI